MELPQLLSMLLLSAGALVVALSVAGAMSLAERRVSAWMQYRIGPNRVGPLGLLQPLADGIKFIFKEEVVPDGARPFLFRLAPVLAATPALLVFALVPFSVAPVAIPGTGVERPLVAADVPLGLLYFAAIGSMGVYGVILGGWSSNNKFSLIGSLRSTAQMISYELPMFLALATAMLMSGSLSLTEICRRQDESGWNVFFMPWGLPLGPLAFLIFLVTMFAETNRHPFDFAECEPELVGGFHTEYSSMKFALFFIGEYAAMFAMSAMMTTLFLGGPDLPFVAVDAMPVWLSLLAFAAKTGAFLFLYLWVRWSLPRFRYDQLMDLGWRKLLPLSLVVFTATGAVVALR